MRGYVFAMTLVLSASCTVQKRDSLAELDRQLDGYARPTAGASSAVQTGRPAAPVLSSDGTAQPAVYLSDGASPWTADADPPEGGEVEDVTARPSGSNRRAPLSSFGETVKRDLREMPGDLWRDTKAVYTSAPQLIILGLAYGGSLAVQETGPDDTIEDSYRHHTVFAKEARDTFNALGHPALHFALAGSWYLLGQQTQNEQTYEVGRTLFSALIINGVSTMLGQAASWDKAPNGEWGTFPSGHTSSTFTVAAVLHDAYGPLVGVPMYGLGALVAMSRLEDGEHYFSDVIMGGVLGLVIGHTVATEHEFELFGGKILPYADPNSGSSGVAWIKELKFRK